MTDTKRNVNEIIQRAANDLKVPNEVAQLIVMVGAELLDLRSKMEWFEQEHLRHSELIRRQTKALEQLRGVHGA